MTLIFAITFFRETLISQFSVIAKISCNKVCMKSSAQHIVRNRGMTNL